MFCEFPLLTTSNHNSFLILWHLKIINYAKGIQAGNQPDYLSKYEILTPSFLAFEFSIMDLNGLAKLFEAGK